MSRSLPWPPKHPASHTVGIHPPHLPAAPGARGQAGGLSLTGHREISSRLSGASQSRSSCCCSSSALSGHGSLTRSGCTLRGERWSVQAGAAPGRAQLAGRGLSVGHLAREPVHPCTRGRVKPKRLQHPVAVQAGHLEQAGHQLLPSPPQIPTPAAWARAAETSTATTLQLSKGPAGQGSASC